MARLVEMILIELLPLLAAVVLLVFGLLWWRRWRRRPRPRPARGQRRHLRPALLGDSGRAFLDALDRAVGREYRVFAHVPLSAVVDTEGGAADLPPGRCLDFLLCDPETLAPACAIQMETPGRGAGTESLITELCREIGLPLLRVPERPAYAVSRLRNLVRERVTAAAVPGVDASREPWIGETHGEEATHPEPDPAAPASEPNCPRCGSPMQARRVSSGAQAGRRVWRCSRYPECPAVVADPRTRTS